MKFFSVLLISFFLTGCVSQSYTGEQQMQVHMGMTTDDIVALFGAPTKTWAANKCEATTGSQPCLYWVYGGRSPLLQLWFDPDELTLIAFRFH